MNLKESLWLKERLTAIPDKSLFPLLNIGSSTLEFRTKVQPYIDENVFRPLRDRGGKIIHLDMKSDEGVDVVGDVCDKAFFGDLRKLGVQSVMLSNLLEHVEAKEQLCYAALDLIGEDGVLILSGPHAYPYHPDPLDNMFRPTVEEVHNLFPGTVIVDSAIIDSGNWKDWNVVNAGGRFPRTLARLALPVYKPKEWLLLASQAPYLLKNIKAFAVILRKTKVSKEL